MARRRSSKKSSTRKPAVGTFLKRSKARGAKLISVVSIRKPQGGSRRVYKVKGHKGWFATLGHAKDAANKIAYAKRRR